MYRSYRNERGERMGKMKLVFHPSCLKEPELAPIVDKMVREGRAVIAEPMDETPFQELQRCVECHSTWWWVEERRIICSACGEVVRR